mmetsp:Transcript_39090/g.59614  ORF Transcript_39090/g.59614 Transcript_39090/m.59614 type:complete len:88 (+) Transcript_39090:134-397(+)
MGPIPQVTGNTAPRRQGPGSHYYDESEAYGQAAEENHFVSTIKELPFSVFAQKVFLSDEQLLNFDECRLFIEHTFESTFRPDRDFLD